MDAFAASPEALPIKIGFAERAIGARLRALPKPEAREAFAIGEALRSLSKLINERSPTLRRQTHFHIHWSSGALDWERFSTALEAEVSAQQLACDDETYTVEEYGEDCPRCIGLRGNEASTA